MSGYLDAECVFSSLGTNKIIKLFNWKKTSPETSKYNVTFEYIDRPADLSFEVTVIEDGTHCIRQIALTNKSRLFSFKPEDILKNCII